MVKVFLMYSSFVLCKQTKTHYIVYNNCCNIIHRSSLLLSYYIETIILVVMLYRDKLVFLPVISYYIATKTSSFTCFFGSTVKH